jgi:hypothetical protein
MKTLLILVSILVAGQAFAIGGLGNKMASHELVARAKANPNLYHFDDGGNINFGNGFYLRRFNFKGQPQVCHAGNFLYAGVRNKCVKPVYSEGEVVGCQQHQQVQLKTQMVGTAQICTDHSDDGGPCGKFSTVKFNKGPQVKVAIFRGRATTNMDSKHDRFQGYAYLTIPRCN